MVLSTIRLFHPALHWSPVNYAGLEIIHIKGILICNKAFMTFECL